MEINEETKKMIMDFQVYQQQLQSIMMQKEALRIQEMEIDKAIEELKSTKEKNAYKISGTVMISRPVEELTKDLEEAKESISIQSKSVEKSATKINDKLKELQVGLKEAMKG